MIRSRIRIWIRNTGFCMAPNIELFFVRWRCASTCTSASSPSSTVHSFRGPRTPMHLGRRKGLTTKYLYIWSTIVYVPSLELGLPHPFSRQRVCPPPRTKGWGAHSPAAEGVGESQFQRLEKCLA
jgi:hypothetical protein